MTNRVSSTKHFPCRHHLNKKLTAKAQQETPKKHANRKLRKLNAKQKSKPHELNKAFFSLLPLQTKTHVSQTKRKSCASPAQTTAPTKNCQRPLGSFESPTPTKNCVSPTRNNKQFAVRDQQNIFSITTARPKKL
jgi:hypothetical protein